MKVDTAVTKPVYKFICEWCESSDIPALAPNACRILRCNKCGGETWHWPKEITDPGERERAIRLVQMRVERLRMNELIAEEMKRVRLEQEYIRAFPYIVSLWGLMAQHISPQPAVTKVKIVPDGEMWIREVVLQDERPYWEMPLEEAISFDTVNIRLEALPLACEGTGTILDGLLARVWHGYSANSGITYWWSEQ